jgi:hypothetical protein
MAGLAVGSLETYGAIPGRAWREKAAFCLLTPFALTSLEAAVLLGRAERHGAGALLLELANVASVSPMG